MGRKSIYTEALGTAICLRIAEGEPLRAICRDKAMPTWSTVYAWIASRPEFAARIERAREVGADAIAQEALEIADTPREGFRVEESEAGTKRIREDMLGHRKLQVETRLKLLAKWHPKKYGEKLEMSASVEISETERAERLAALLAVAQKRKEDGSGA